MATENNVLKPLCVIPARRGSKRLALKNILPLGGVPMLAHTVQAALDSGIFERVLVSTEDEEIAGIAVRCGAEAHDRPDELAGDLVSATDVCLEVADVLEGQGHHHDAVVCLQPSSPLRNGEDIRLSWQQMLTSGSDYLVSVTPVDPHYFHWAVHETGTDWAMFFGDRFLLERPLLPPVFRPNGAIKIGRLAPLRQTRNFFGRNLTTYSMPEDRSIHVAEQFDFDLAAYLLQRQGGA
jgi:CMP-N-acetylneuraminic acid synthetase